MPAVMRAFSIVCLVLALYGIVGTDFFSEVDPENFGSFFVSAFTLFEAMTFNWVTICRDLMHDSGYGI
jgi:hypothetical protein